MKLKLMRGDVEGEVVVACSPLCDLHVVNTSVVHPAPVMRNDYTTDAFGSAIIY